MSVCVQIYADGNNLKKIDKRNLGKLALLNNIDRRGDKSGEVN